jgi:hypothetical protein
MVVFMGLLSGFKGKLLNESASAKLPETIENAVIINIQAIL